MTYSCADFADAVLELLADRGWIDGERIPDDNPSAQFEIVAAAIERHIDREKRLAQALRDLLAWFDGNVAYFGDDEPRSGGSFELVKNADDALAAAPWTRNDDDKAAEAIDEIAHAAHAGIAGGWEPPT